MPAIGLERGPLLNSTVEKRLSYFDYFVHLGLRKVPVWTILAPGLRPENQNAANE